MFEQTCGRSLVECSSEKRAGGHLDLRKAAQPESGTWV